ncbi:Scr1 family TA system antitoxin-like transcriptional regulator [Glycomyces xiaoerkulensis]|uniref:Scr1 family TA system antitoxin-like transcriptional regulator n=1 Tax=Glycomyces xiaoerkulensis TaxID=2038139 RepID=UPI000C256514|nr:Scr1 family TA system antitoxin-like transcriptional regulator [Glycomyces xiaoerkulensis]
MPAPSKLTRWQVGIYIHDHRTELGFSQTELAVRLGVSGATISNWERGASMPSAGEVWGLARHLKIPDEIAEFMETIAREGSSPNMEAHPRYNALGLAKAELHYNSIWKWEPLILPGIVQTRHYNSLVVQQAEGTTDEQAQFGWNFKQQRQNAIMLRPTEYRMTVIIGDSAVRHLTAMPERERREQVDYLRECNSRPGWEIRIMNQHSDLGGPFEVYVSSQSTTAGPPFVYVQIHDLSWCIEERDRVKGYHDRVKTNWPRATELEVYLDAERDLLA